jgi:putative addiction module component (TIGR02574 family)
MQLSDIPEITKLSIPEKILFLEELWDTIIVRDAEIQVPESHKAELDKRLKRHRSSRGKLLTLEELQARIVSRK